MRRLMRPRPRRYQEYRLLANRGGAVTLKESRNDPRQPTAATPPLESAETAAEPSPMPTGGDEQSIASDEDAGPATD